MQLGLVQFLLGSGFPGGAAPAGEETGGDLFSQLLGDMGTDGGQQQAQPSLLTADITPAALLAQELDPASLAALQRGDAQALTQLLGKPITPQIAGELLTQMESLGFERGQDEAFDQLHEALEFIEQTGEPVDVAQLLESLPAVEAAPTPAERAPLMQRMLTFLHGALEKKKEAPQDLAALSAPADGATQSLQASLFRPNAAAAAPASAQTGDTATEEAAPQTDLSVEPVELISLTMPPAASAIPAWVRKISDETVPTDIDVAVPALTPVEDTALPAVDLPGGDDIAATAEPVTATPVAPKTIAKEQQPAFAEHLAALPERPIVLEAVANQTATQVDSSGVVQVGQVSAPASHSSMTPQTHSAIAHTHVPTAAAEQVQVAITTANKDGLDRITMQLEPADLGRVEVRMETGLDGRTQVHFTVDKAETLEALARDARALERSLQEAGIKADAGSMQFNLRQQPQFSDMGGNGKGGNQHATDDNDGTAMVATTDAITKHYTINVREGVDIHA